MTHSGHGHADRAAPVLPHGDEVVQLEVIDELPDCGGLLLDGVPEIIRMLRKAETQVVHRDASELAAQPGNNVAIQEAPRWVSVKEDDRGPLALVDIVDATATAIKPSRLEWIETSIYNELGYHSALPLLQNWVAREGFRLINSTAPATANAMAAMMSSTANSHDQAAT